MRRIAVINQKGGVGKTTTVANLGAALARMGRRVVLVDMDPQANLTLHLGVEPGDDRPSTYGVLGGQVDFASTLVGALHENLRLAPSHIDLAGAELELASTIGRESALADAIDEWERSATERDGRPPADYVIIDCPPSLGLLSVNALVAVREVVIALQTEFFALQGLSKVVDVIELLRRRINPALEMNGILASLYDGRLKLAREVLAEVRKYFPGRVFDTKVRLNVKLAEAPSYGCSIFEYAPASNGARDYLHVAREVMEQESRDPELAARALPVPDVASVRAVLTSEPDREEDAPQAEPSVPAETAEDVEEAVHEPLAQVDVPRHEARPESNATVHPESNGVAILESGSMESPEPDRSDEEPERAAPENVVCGAPDPDPEAKTEAGFDSPRAGAPLPEPEPELEPEPERPSEPERASEPEPERPSELETEPERETEMELEPEIVLNPSVPGARQGLPVRDYGYYLGEDRPEICGQRGPWQRRARKPDEEPLPHPTPGS